MRQTYINRTYIKTITAAAAFAAVLCLASPAPVQAMAGCGGECADCHSLEVPEAQKLLKADRFKAEVTGIKMSEVKGLWEVSLKNQKDETIVVFVDFGKRYLVEGKFTPIKEVGEPPELKKVDRSRVPLDDAIIMGNPKAPNKFIVFDDPECPYCRKFHSEIKRIVAERPEIAFYIKMFPLPMHPGAYDKSKSIVCAKSVEALEAAFAGKELAAATCKSDAVDKTIKVAEELGIKGTPAVIFPDGRLLPGYVEAEGLLFIMDNGGQNGGK